MPTPGAYLVGPETGTGHRLAVGVDPGLRASNMWDTLYYKSKYLGLRD